jgi:hypothetical protein
VGQFQISFGSVYNVDLRSGRKHGTIFKPKLSFLGTNKRGKGPSKMRTTVFAAVFGFGFGAGAAAGTYASGRSMG